MRTHGLRSSVCARYYRVAERELALRSGRAVSAVPWSLSSAVPKGTDRREAVVRSAWVPGFRLFGYSRDTGQ